MSGLSVERWEVSGGEALRVPARQRPLDLKIAQDPASSCENGSKIKGTMLVQPHHQCHNVDDEEHSSLVQMMPTRSGDVRRRLDDRR